MDGPSQTRQSAASSREHSEQSSVGSVNDKLIAERVTVLLSHYWTANEDPRLRELQMLDWLDDLAEFPASAVAEAVKRWRQGPGSAKRPLPYDIRATCLELQSAAQMRLGHTGDKATELRNRHVQMLVAFRRWDKEWGAYPCQSEVDEVMCLRTEHEASVLKDAER